jgi:magnesium-transporting ATPase (P-type)
VKEGRTVYNNIEKAILFMLPTNVAQALVIAVAIFFGFSVLQRHMERRATQRRRLRREAA